VTAGAFIAPIAAAPATPPGDTVRPLQAPLDAALRAAQAAFLAVAAPQPPEQWILPPGTATINGPLPLGAAGRSLRIVGTGGTVLALAGGDLTITGGEVSVAQITVNEAAGADLTVTGGQVSVAQVTVSGPAGADLTITGAQVSVDQITVSGSGAGLALRGGVVQASGVGVTGGGNLRTTGTTITANDLSVTGAASPIAVDVQGVDVVLSAIRVQGGAATPAQTVGVSVTAASSAAVSDAQIHDLTAARAVGLQVVAPAVRLSGITASRIHQTGAGATPPATPPLLTGLDAAGVLVEATQHVDAISIDVDTVTGVRPAGVRIVCAGEGAPPPAAAAPGWLYAVEIQASNIQGSTEAAGAIIVSGGLLRLRGFLASGVTGGAPSGSATGIFALGVQRLDVSVGRVEQVSSAPGGNAVGVRLLGGSTGTTTIGDVAVEAVGRTGAGAALPAATAWGPQAKIADAQTALTTGGAALASALAADLTAPWADDAGPPPGSIVLPALHGVAAVIGLQVTAVVDETDPTALTVQRPALTLMGASVHRVGGAAVCVEGGVRSVVVRRVDVWAAASAGYLHGEELLAAELTLDTLGKGLTFGPGDVTVFDSLLTRIASGPAITLGQDATLTRALAVFTDATSPLEDPRISHLGALHYQTPGATAVDPGWTTGAVPPAPAQPIDLSLVPSADLDGKAQRVTGDPPGVAFIGAFAPDQPPAADDRDPETRPAPPRTAGVASSPLTTYTARDAGALLALMTARAQAVMPDWTIGNPADFTTVVLELLAERLDHLAYMQESAVAEGYIGQARRRRSVEDHARALDCPPDPGLSATAMIRFQLDPTVVNVPPGTPRFVVTTDTLIGNPTADEAAIFFATEEPLVIVPEIDVMWLSQATAAGDVQAYLADQPGLDQLAVGRWLVFAADGDPHNPGCVVKITVIERAGDVTLIQWDPRRPLPGPFAARGDGSGAPLAAIYGNVVPAHHGIPLWTLDGETADTDPLFGRWRQLLTLTVEGGPSTEVPLPLAPVSAPASGYPLPSDTARAGVVSLRVSVDGDEWQLADDLSLYGPGDQVFVLRSADDGGTVLRFGDDVNGTSLPPRPVQVDLDVRIGLGKVGNVGVGQLTRLIQLGPGGTSAATWLGDTPPGPPSDDLLRALITVSNPLPAVEGRDPDPIDHLRYRAPLGVMDALSGVTPADCERLLEDLPEVAAARAQVLDGGPRPLIRMTVLLRDDDVLGDDERLRRFADVRRTLEDIRLLGFDVSAVPPTWVPLDLDALVDADPHQSAPALRDAVIQAIGGVGGMLDPDVIGLGGDVHLSALYQAILQVPGVTGAVVRRFRRLEPGAVDHLADGTIPVAPDEVAIVLAPDGGASGLFTVTVRGGVQ
jgi:hypothetical protein